MNKMRYILFGGGKWLSGRSGASGGGRGPVGRVGDWGRVNKTKNI